MSVNRSRTRQFCQFPRYQDLFHHDRFGGLQKTTAFAGLELTDVLSKSAVVYYLTPQNVRFQSCDQPRPGR